MDAMTPITDITNITSLVRTPFPKQKRWSESAIAKRGIKGRANRHGSNDALTLKGFTDMATFDCPILADEVFELAAAGEVLAEEIRGLVKAFQNGVNKAPEMTALIPGVQSALALFERTKDSILP